MGLKRILTPLDIHLDTRLGTIARLDPDVAKKLLETNDYWTRENDNWDVLTHGKITTEEFNTAYKERGGSNTNDTLQHSVRTNITPFIMRLLTDDQVNKMNQMSEPDDAVSLVVNYWPYELTPDGIESVRAIMHYFYGSMTEVEMISVPLVELTPDFMNENFAACIMYEFGEWTKTHAVGLGKARMNCFNFIGPTIFEADVSKMTPQAKQYILDAFRFEKLIHMDFEWIDASYFSVINVHGADRPAFPSTKDEEVADLTPEESELIPE
jgi:hypothetical protein